MPRFFFNITDGSSTLLDDCGRELKDSVHAAKVAKQQSALLGTLSRNWIVQVTDQKKIPIYYSSATRAYTEPVSSHPNDDRHCQSETINSCPVSSSETRLSDLERRASISRQTEQIARVGGWEIDLNTKQLFWSDEMFRIYDLPVGDAPSFKESLRSFLGNGRRVLRRALATAVRENEPFNLEMAFISAKGRKKWVRVRGSCEASIGPPKHIYGALVDISERKVLDDRIWRLANHDALTDLPNRRLFQQRLDAGLAETSRLKTTLALAIIDLDDFKEVNDTLGYPIGDALLCELATRLRGAIRTADTVARLGGDEFAVILPNLAADSDASNIMQKIQEVVRQPIKVGDQDYTCASSVGISIFPSDGSDKTELLKNADIALYWAKALGRGGLVSYAPQMGSSVRSRAAVVSQVKSALDGNRILPFYQPKVSLQTGAIVGFEALLRWKHPELGIQLPGTIAQAFEDRTLAPQLADRMLDSILTDIKHWTANRIPFGHIAINVASAELYRHNFANRMLAQLGAQGIDPQLLEVEITENVFMNRRSSEVVVQAMTTLSNAGVRIALDDFGTGYASLVHLKQFPVNALKIDRSFILDLENDRQSKAIICSIIKLSHGLGVTLVAEGVETVSQADFLRREGCEQAQGFLYSKAVPAAEVPILLAGDFSENGRLAAELDRSEALARFRLAFDSLTITQSRAR